MTNSEEVRETSTQEAVTTPETQQPPQPSWWRRQLRWSNLLSILLIAAFIILGYYIWQGEGVFITVDRNQTPFEANQPRQPQDVGQMITVSQSGGNQNAVLVQEDFTAVRGSWRFSPPDQASFFGQGLLLDDNAYTGEAWAQPGLTFENFVLKVKSRWVGGSLSGSYGIRIRKNSESGEFLALYLHNDGRFTIAEQSRLSLETVVNQYNSAIQINGGINEIQIEASGDVVHFFVNNAYLGTYNDPIPATGGIEFVAIKAEELEGSDTYKAAFDDLTITHNFMETVQNEN